MELNIDNSKIPPILEISFTDLDPSPFFQVLEEGYSSELIYTIRVRCDKTPLTLIIPSSNVYNIVKKANKDFLSGQYVIISNNRRKAHDNAENFTSDFFTCLIEVPYEYLDHEDCYIEAKAVADLIKRPQPLSLLEPFMTSEKTTTGWIQLGNKQ